MMLPVGLLFGALWLTALVQGRRMDDHTERVDAQWHAAQETPASEPVPASDAGERPQGTDRVAL